LWHFTASDAESKGTFSTEKSSHTLSRLYIHLILGCVIYLLWLPGSPIELYFSYHSNNMMHFGKVVSLKTLHFMHIFADLECKLLPYFLFVIIYRYCYTWLFNQCFFFKTLDHSFVRFMMVTGIFDVIINYLITTLHENYMLWNNFDLKSETNC